MLMDDERYADRSNSVPVSVLLTLRGIAPYRLDHFLVLCPDMRSDHRSATLQHVFAHRKYGGCSAPRSIVPDFFVYNAHHSPILNFFRV